MTAKTLSDVTIQHLGPDATDSDLDDFRNACRTLIERKACSEAEAIETVFGDGDYLQNITALGL